MAFVACLALACTRSQNSDARIKQALDIYSTHPDSALAILQGVDKSSLDEKDLATYSLVYSMALDKSGVDVDNDSLLRIAYDYFVNRAEDSLYARCMYYMGNYYRLLGKREEAISCLESAITVSRAAKEYNTTCLALERLSKIKVMTSPAEALGLAREALELYLDQQDVNIYNKVYYKLNYGVSLMYVGQLSQALKECKQALDIAFMANDSLLISESCQDISCIQNEMCNTDSSLHYAKLACKYNPQANPSLFHALASAYIVSDSLDAARHILETKLSMQKSEFERYVYYSKLHLIAIKELDYDKAVVFSDSIETIMESMYAKELDNKDKYYLEKLQSEKDRMYAESELANHKKILSYFIITAIVATFFTIVFFRVRKNNARQKLQHEIKLAEERQVHEREIMQLEFEMKEKLHEEKIRHKEQQITMMRNYVLKKVDVAEKIASLQDSDKKHALLTDSDWEEISDFLNSVEDMFVVRLRESFPLLSTKDIQLMMLLRLGVSTKTLASIFCIAENSIKQKLFLYKEKVSIQHENLSLRSFIESF